MAEDSNNLHDNSIGWFFIALVMLGVIWLLWYFFKTDIRDAVRWIRYGEMWLIQWFVPDDYTVMFNGKLIRWHDFFADTPTYKATELTSVHLGLFSALAMQPLKYVFCGLMGVGAIWCILSGPRTHNRTDLGLEGLIRYQSKNFPIIKPFVEFNPSKQPPRPPGSPVPAELPPFAEALGPEEWLAYHSVNVPDGKVDQQSAKKAFQKQLLGRWKGANGLPDYLQILLAAFCLKASRKRSQSDDLIGRLASCWHHEKGLQLSKDKGLLKEARKILKTKDLAAKTLAQANRHAFVTTALLRALQFAREEGGVLAPAQFVWLRAYNRALWYPLNNLGRQSFHLEAIGAMAHFKAERLTQRPIPSPQLDFAVTSISEYMTTIDARPIPPLDYKGTKKRAIKKAV